MPDAEPFASTEPFERRVTTGLSRSLTAIADALPFAHATQDIAAFEQASNTGISANLCDALAGMGMADESCDVGIRLSYASSFPSPVAAPTFRFAAESLPLLKQIAQKLREQSSFGSVEIQGTVVELRRDEGDLQGNITVASVVDGRIRRIGVELLDEDYNWAIQAHQYEVPITIESELERDGRSLRLSNPRNLSRLS